MDKKILKKSVFYAKSEELDGVYHEKFLPKDSEYDHYIDWVDEGTNLEEWPISIEWMEEQIKAAKEAGADHLAIMFHPDHVEYEVEGLVIREMTEEEIEQHNAQKEAEVAARLLRAKAQYEAEVARIKRTLED